MEFYRIKGGNLEEQSTAGQMADFRSPSVWKHSSASEWCLLPLAWRLYGCQVTGLPVFFAKVPTTGQVHLVNW
jgi:hypothetical protein